MAKFTLEHAKQWDTGLTLDISPGSVFDPEALWVVLFRSARFETLVCPAARQTHEAIHRPWNHKLERVSIWETVFTTRVIAHKHDLKPVRPHFDENLFRGVTEKFAKAIRKFRELRLHGDVLRFDADMLLQMSLLTTLEVTLPHRVWRDLDELFMHLRSMPLLHTLALRGEVLPPHDPEDPGAPSSDAIVPLLHLRNLCLHAGDHVHFRILQFLSVPSCTRVALFANADHSSVSYWDINQVLHGQLAVMLESHRSSLKHLHLHMRDHQSTRPYFERLHKQLQNAHPSVLPNMMSHFQHLRTLNLWFSRTSYLGRERDLMRPTTLPLLERLHVSAPWNTIARVSQFLQTPNTTYRSYSIRSVLDERQASKTLSADIRPVLESLVDRKPDQTGAHYTRLDVVPLHSSSILGLRVVASGRTSTSLRPAVDISFQCNESPVYDRNVLNFYAQAIYDLLDILPLDTLDTVYIADPEDILGREVEQSTTPGEPRALKCLAHARTIEIAFYPNTMALLLQEASAGFTQLERIVLRSVTLNDDAALAMLWRSIVPLTIPVRLSVESCAILEQGLEMLRAWVGVPNFEWDGRTRVDCEPSWGAYETPWLAPDAREERFWRPDVWEDMYWTPTDALVDA